MRLLRPLAAERILAHSARVDSGEALLRRLLAQLDTALARGAGLTGAACAPSAPLYDAGTSRDVLERKTSVSVTYTIPLEDKS